MTLQLPPPLRWLGREASHPWDVYVLSLDTLAEFPEQLGLPCPRFVLLLAADTTSTDRAAVASRILDSGCVYFCSWGPGCKAMREAVDARYMDRLEYAEEQGVVMSTSHEDDTLSSAVEYAVISAWPDDFYLDGCEAVVLAAAGNDAWRFLMQSTASAIL